MTKQDVGAYLQDALLPEVANRQVKLTEKPTTLEHLVGVVASLVEDKHSTLALPEVRMIVSDLCKS